MERDGVYADVYNERMGFVFVRVAVCECERIWV